MGSHGEITPGSRFICRYSRDDTFNSGGVIVENSDPTYYNVYKVLLDKRKRATTLAHHWITDITPPELMIGDEVVCDYGHPECKGKTGVILEYRGAVQVSDGNGGTTKAANVYLVQFYHSKRKHVLGECFLKRK